MEENMIFIFNVHKNTNSINLRLENPERRLKIPMHKLN